MPSSYKKYAYNFGLASLSLLLSSCMNTLEGSSESNHHSQTKSTLSTSMKIKNEDGFDITSLPYNSNAHLTWPPVLRSAEGLRKVRYQHTD